jgi:hypothetical protein
MVELKKHYGGKREMTEHERNQASLRASKKIAAGVKKIQFTDPHLSYEKAEKRYFTENPEMLAEYACLPDPPEEEEVAAMDSLEASDILARKAKELMWDKNLSFSEASDRIFSDPANATIVRAYTLNS